MGSIISSFISGFVRVIGNFFGAPIDFLSGRNCSSICGPTWDLICYIENFCIVNLLKLLAVAVLSYIVLLFVYLLHKIGIFDCLCKGICKIFWACVVSCFSACEYVCTLMWFKLKTIRKTKEYRLRDIEEYGSIWSYDGSEESLSFSHTPREVRYRRWLTQRSRERRRMCMKNSLRPRSHKMIVGLSRDSIHVKERRAPYRSRRSTTVQNIKVTRTSKFVKKSNVNKYHHTRRCVDIFY